MPNAQRPRREDRAALYDNPSYRDVLLRLSVNLRRMRGERGWTQEEAADHCGMSFATYHPIERGKLNITVLTSVRLAEGFGVDVLSLFAEITDEERTFAEAEPIAISAYSRPAAPKQKVPRLQIGEDGQVVAKKASKPRKNQTP